MVSLIEIKTSFQIHCFYLKCLLCQTEIHLINISIKTSVCRVKSLPSSLKPENTSWLTNLIREKELPGKGNFLIYLTSFTKVLFIKLRKKKVDLKFKFENLSVIFKQLLYIWLGNRENSEFSFHNSEFSEKNTLSHTVLHNLTVPLNEKLMLSFPVELCVPFAILLKPENQTLTLRVLTPVTQQLRLFAKGTRKWGQTWVAA